MKNIAVILSGCGYLDGAEVTESVSLLISLSKLNANYNVYAPNKNFLSVAHLDESLSPSTQRNALEESARITRGKVKNIEDLNAKRYDGLALAGGYGVAKNLSTWAQDGKGCSVNKNLKEAILEFHKNSKPILGICIAPAILAKALHTHAEPCLTIGEDPETAQQISKMGAEHVNCSATDYVTDRENKIISTPAYMLDAKPHEVFEGIGKACSEFLEMC